MSVPLPNTAERSLGHGEGRSVRLIYVALIAVTIPLGLASRVQPIPMPEVVRRFGGDVLSAVCIYFGVRLVLHHHRPRWMALTGGFVVCVLIELQQLYRGGWLVQLRDGTPLGILLGHGFLWSDIGCYAVGSVMGAALGWGAEVAIGTGALRSRARTTPS